MGLPMHAMVCDPINTIYPNLRYKSHDTCRSRGTFLTTTNIGFRLEQGESVGRSRPHQRTWRSMQDNRGSVQITGDKEVKFKVKTEKLSERRFSVLHAQ